MLTNNIKYQYFSLLLNFRVENISIITSYIINFLFIFIYLKLIIFLQKYLLFKKSN